MGKSQFTVVLLYSFALNINTGYALRCYGCGSDGSKEMLPTLVAEYDATIPKDYPNCEDGYGKEFDCPGTCMKLSKKGTSEFFSKT